ncbi:MAG TPA: aminotransferase class V-fold PLP-dependent enzyme [Fimbriimonadaceae bacterium]|jgi:cysteine desulfurase family protein (TIGR01976 family)
MPISTPENISQIRAQFPALQNGFIYLENAGGSQVPATVPQAMHDYMLNDYVQLGAGYPISQRATEIVAEAHSFANRLMNGERTGKTILGPSTTQLCYMLAECYERLLTPGDEIIIAETAHEANAGPWAKLANKGFTVRTWRVNPETFQCDTNELKNLITENTKIVAFPHVSNLLGEVVDVQEITRVAHTAGAKVVVDGVAYAPHRLIDVESWGVDYYVFSIYKVFGPHMAALYANNQALAHLEGPNHFFVPKDDVYKFELGGVSHEACAGLLGVKPYLEMLGGEREAFLAMAEMELPLQARLIEYLKSKPQVRIIGPGTAGPERVPTISFVHKTKDSAKITAEVDKCGIGIRHGHMYAYRLCKKLGLSLQTGVVRISAVHYNTLEEIDKLISVLNEIL